MDVRAIVVLGSPAEARETMAGYPLALSHVLGKPVAFRVIERLRAAGACDITVITEAPPSMWPTGAASHGTWAHAAGEEVWRKAEEVFEEFVDDGAELVLSVRLGPYAEINYEDVIQRHVSGRQRITAVVDAQDIPVEIFAISASRRNDAAYLLRHQMREFRSSCEFYKFEGHVNRLSSAHDLRNLAIDGLMQRIELAPVGEQIKPGVWACSGAQIHRRARIVGPAFIGAGSRVRAAAVVTRCTALEHHTVVDCGTVMENASTLPYTYVGAGLDVAHSVVGHSRVWNLRRNVEVEFADARLIGEAPANAPLRALGSLLSLASFLPAQLLRGFFTANQPKCPPTIPDAINAPAAALEAPVNRMAPAVDTGEFPGNLVIARRYGGNE